MKVSEMILELEKFKEENGDLQVFRYDSVTGSISEHPGPKVRYTRVLIGREYLLRFFSEYSDGPERRGAQVCHL